MTTIYKKDGIPMQWFTLAALAGTLNNNTKVRILIPAQRSYRYNTLYTRLSGCGFRVLETGNDAPRGGKLGMYVVFEIPKEVQVLRDSIIQEAKEQVERMQKAIEQRKQRYLSLVEENRSEIERRAKQRKQTLTCKESNKQLRKLAHNIAASVIGEYGSAGMEIAYRIL